jgi:hypothetical protein
MWRRVTFIVALLATLWSGVVLVAEYVYAANAC